MHELVKGTLRWRGRLDWALDPLVHIGLGQVQPWIKNILRLGAYQILFLDRVPPHAAVDESVKLAHKYGHPGTAGLVNSVLRRLAEERETIAPPAGDDAESLAVWGSHPRWIVERWLARFGPEATRALLLADNRSVPVGLRVNRLRLTRDELIARLGAAGVERDAGAAGAGPGVDRGHAGARRRSTSSSAGCARCRTRARRWSAAWSRPSRTSGCSTCAPRPAARARTWRS